MIRYHVTDRRQGNLLSSIQSSIRDGVDMIQVREKDLPANELFDLVCQLRDAASGSRTRILVNDRLDVALAAGVDGVHLPGHGLPLGQVRPFVRLLGCSVHSIDEAVKAEREGADFAVFGPVFASPGKTAVGLEALRSVAASVRMPILAIGGVSSSNTPLVLAAGAAGIAAIRLFQRD